MERLSPHEYESTVEDPREELLIEMSPQIEAYLESLHDPTITQEMRNDAENAIADFERGVAAQIFEVQFEPVMTPEGSRMRIRVYIPQYGDAGFLPQDKRRTDWEKWRDLNHPIYRQNVQTATALHRALHLRHPLSQAVELPHIRIGIGSIYQFSDPQTGQRQQAIRVNNDPNNIYHNWGNPMSSLLKIVRRGTKPIKARNSSVEEIILAKLIDGQVQPFYDQKFLAEGGQRKYKEKALIVEGSEPDRPLLVHPYNTTLQPDIYDTGIDLVFDYSDLGDDRLYQMKNVNALLTPEGTLEIQVIINTEAPDLLYDREHASDIVVATTDEIAEWAYAASQGQYREFDYQAIVDGATGQPTNDPAKLAFYRQHFQASPPLWVPFGRVLEQKNRE